MVQRGSILLLKAVSFFGGEVYFIPREWGLVHTTTREMDFMKSIKSGFGTTPIIIK